MHLQNECSCLFRAQKEFHFQRINKLNQVSFHAQEQFVQAMGRHAHHGVERTGEGRHANQAHHILYTVCTRFVHGRT